MLTIINPFRYSPSKEVIKASEELIKNIKQSELHEDFNEGKMLGVMIVRPNSDTSVEVLQNIKEIHPLEDFYYIAAFSGNIGGENIISGFVPPIYNLLEKTGYFKQEEAKISKLSALINDLESNDKLQLLKEKLHKYEKGFEEQSNKIKDEISKARSEREKLRAGCNDSVVLARLITESQNEKANFRRLKKEAKEKIQGLVSEIQSIEIEIKALKLQRARMSEKLQSWIFKQYIIHNFQGEESNIYDIFRKQRLVPPSGSGDCAGPKLFEYAIKHGLEPLAFGEFWYGASPEGPVRNHGDFYPACSSKCGIILSWMMKGLKEFKEPEIEPQIDVFFEDEWLIAINKAAGVPSVPGLDGRKSMLEVLEEHYQIKFFIVHRLDMDTSGLILYAKTQEIASTLQMQFEERLVNKTYRARLRPSTKYDSIKDFRVSDTGIISLPLSPMYEDRPRQMVDFNNGKEAITKYEVLTINKDGSIDIVFHPITGRTHQLRVHAAHHLGLGRPILGDKLYGGNRIDSPLMLEASELSFNHPITEEKIYLYLL